MQAKHILCNQRFTYNGVEYRKVTAANCRVVGASPIDNASDCIIAVDSRGHLHLIHGDNAVELAAPNPTQRDYAMALQSQDAVNAFALINSLAEVAPRVRAVAPAGDDFIRHPIVKLYLEQLYSLSGYGSGYADCLAICQDHAALAGD